MTARTGSRELCISSAAVDAAGDWDTRLRAPDCTNDDRADFAVWCDSNPSHRAAYEALQTIVASLRHDRGRADVRSLRDEALRVTGARRSRRRLRFGAAAASVIVLGICTTLWRAHTVEWLRSPLNELVARLTGAEYVTGIGQRSTFTLSDGSTVELNAQSRIRIAFTESRRDVELAAGQALFNVAKNPRRPFIVHAGNREITAVGTQFDVRLDSRSVQVTLIEGKVRVQRSNSPTSGERAQRQDEISSGTAEIITLTPGKQLIAKLTPLHVSEKGPGSGTSFPLSVRGDGPGVRIPEEGLARREGEDSADTVRDIDVAKATGWREGRIFLEDLSLEDAVAEMNKYSATQIKLTDPAPAGLRLNGMFMAGGQQAFATALESYFPIAAERHGDNEIVLTSRH